jgi:high frequency lysogenization protein
MAKHTDIERTLALAALYQALEQVLTLARTGDWDAEAAGAALSGLFVFDAPDAAGVYGGAAWLRRGLRGMQHLLAQSNTQQGVELIRLAVPVLQLERSLRQRPEMLARIGETLTTLKPRLRHTVAQDDDLITPLAELYQRTLSTLEPRIRVRGEPKQLGRPEVAARIRALLLAAVRAAVLWRQCGGSRLHFLLRRGALASSVRQLLQPAPASH